MKKKSMERQLSIDLESYKESASSTLKNENKA